MAEWDTYVPDPFIRALKKARPALKKEAPDIQGAVAYLVWVRDTKSRAHKARDGEMSISYQELARHFGRGKFREINDRLSIFDVT
ncbi:MAG: hypothetical protein ACKO96_33850, partial [Flammeovirgaceae bacterium]